MKRLGCIIHKELSPLFPEEFFFFLMQALSAQHFPGHSRIVRMSGATHFANTDCECGIHLAVLFRPALQTVTRKPIILQSLSKLYISAYRFAAQFPEPGSRITIHRGQDAVKEFLSGSRLLANDICIMLSGDLDPEYSSGLRRFILEHIPSAL